MQTKYITATQAQTTLSDLFDWVDNGNRVIFMKYGREIGEFTPVKRENTRIAYKNKILNWIEENALETDEPIDSTSIIRRMRDEE